MDKEYLMLLEVQQYHVLVMEMNGKNEDLMLYMCCPDQIAGLPKH